MNPAFAKWIHQHKSQPQGHGQRLGQDFVNTFIKGQWPELFYCSDEAKAIELINTWLQDHHYFDVLPAPVRAIDQIHKGTTTFTSLLNKKFPYQR